MALPRPDPAAFIHFNPTLHENRWSPERTGRPAIPATLQNLQAIVLGIQEMVEKIDWAPRSRHLLVLSDIEPLSVSVRDLSRVAAALDHNPMTDLIFPILGTFTQQVLEQTIEYIEHRSAQIQDLQDVEDNEFLVLQRQKQTYQTHLRNLTATPLTLEFLVNVLSLRQEHQQWMNAAHAALRIFERNIDIGGLQGQITASNAATYRYFRQSIVGQFSHLLSRATARGERPAVVTALFQDTLLHARRQPRDRARLTEGMMRAIEMDEAFVEQDRSAAVPPRSSSAPRMRPRQLNNRH